MRWRIEMEIEIQNDIERKEKKEKKRGKITVGSLQIQDECL